MNDLLTHPVTPIVAIVCGVAVLIAIFTKVASKRRKEEQRKEAERRAELRIAREMQEALDRKRSRVIRGLEQTTSKVRRKDAPVRRPASKPAPQRPGFRTDATPPQRPSRTDDNPGYDAMGMLAMGYLLSDPTPGNDDSYRSTDNSPAPDPSPSPSYDSGSSGGSSDSSGGSFGGGDSGSF